MLQALRDPLRTFTDFAVHPPSYIVFAGDSRYYVKSGDTGQIEYSDTDPLNVLNYVVGKARGKDVIVVKGTYNLGGRVWVINKAGLVVLGYGATIVNGGVRLEEAHITFFAGFTFTYGAPGVPCIHRKTTVYSTIADIFMQNVDIGIVEESTDKVNIVNRAYNIHVEWANTVGARFVNSGQAGNNLNTYYGLFVHGGGTGVEFTGPNPDNPQNQGNQFFGLWLEDMQTGIKYYNGLRTTIYGVWFEKNANYDIDIGQGGFDIAVFGVLYPAMHNIKVNNPYNRAYAIYHDSINAGTVVPGRICRRIPCTDSDPYIFLPNNLIFNIGRGQAFRFWQNSAVDGELRIWFHAPTRRAIIRAMADPGIVLGTAGGRVDKITMYPHTSLPSDDEGSLRLYYDGTSYKLCVYAGGSWKCVTLT